MPDATPLSIVFMGTPDLAAVVLGRLADWPRGRILGVVSQPDRPKGRDLQTLPTPVKSEAQRRQLPLFQPDRARSPEFLDQLRSLKPDLIVVAAYGQLLPQALLDIPRLGCLNVHTSLLPKYRGAAPIQWAIANGEPLTGVTIMRMDAGLDTGPILSAASTPISDSDTSQSLHDRLADLGASLLLETIPAYANGALVPVPQPLEGVSLARRIAKEDGRIDWNHPARLLWCRLRAFTPWPGAFCHFQHGGKPKSLKVHRADVFPSATAVPPGTVLRADKEGILVACGVDALLLREIQPEGGRRQTSAEFLAGHALTRLE